MCNNLLHDLQHVHGAEVKGDVRLGVGIAADPRQYRCGKVRPAVGYGVADRRIKIGVSRVMNRNLRNVRV
jgi:hypothetical protein